MEVNYKSEIIKLLTTRNYCVCVQISDEQRCATERHTRIDVAQRTQVAHYSFMVR